ncbi:MAG: hypothetical protein HQK51_02615 [Oligoflexia bacterium]|nr:hypothetical protein [Oligoflexia bacterium]
MKMKMKTSAISISIDRKLLLLTAFMFSSIIVIYMNINKSSAADDISNNTPSTKDSAVKTGNQKKKKEKEKEKVKVSEKVTCSASTAASAEPVFKDEQVIKELVISMDAQNITDAREQLNKQFNKDMEVYKSEVDDIIKCVGEILHSRKSTFTIEGIPNGEYLKNATIVMHSLTKKDTRFNLEAIKKIKKSCNDGYLKNLKLIKTTVDQDLINPIYGCYYNFAKEVPTKENQLPAIVVNENEINTYNWVDGAIEKKTLQYKEKKSDVDLINVTRKKFLNESKIKIANKFMHLASEQCNLISAYKGHTSNHLNKILANTETSLKAILSDEVKDFINGFLEKRLVCKAYGFDLKLGVKYAVGGGLSVGICKNILGERKLAIIPTWAAGSEYGGITFSLTGSTIKVNKKPGTKTDDRYYKDVIVGAGASFDYSDNENEFHGIGFGAGGGKINKGFYPIRIKGSGVLLLNDYKSVRDALKLPYDKLPKFRGED